MRSEQEIFDELAALCTSPGYVHALAHLSFRDNIVPYVEEMTARDMQHFFSRERLIRTETSTLIALLVKADIDYALPTPDITQQYITTAEALLEELHGALLHEMVGVLDLKHAVEARINPFDRGAAFREPIFYSGESAYSFQYRDFSPRKYGADNEWLEINKGFSIGSARDVVHGLQGLQTQKLGALVDTLRRSHPDAWTMLPGFTFSSDELAEFAKMDRALIEIVLTAFTLPQGERNQTFRSLQDFNATNATPILRLDGNAFVLFQQYSLAEALYESPFYWMTEDDAYRDSALLNRGRFTENFSRERLECVFGRDRVFPNVDIYERKGKKVGEIDVLVLFGDRAIVLQAKSKGLTLEARKGNDNQLKADFKKSVQESYDQGYTCAVSLSDRSLRFIDANGRVPTFPN